MHTFELLAPPGVTAIELLPRAGGRARVRTTSAQLRAMVLHTDGNRARVALVPESALLLAGDNIRLEMTVGAGCEIELVEPGGTVAYDMRGGTAQWNLRVRIAERGRLVWHGQPFVVSSGARVERRTEILLEEAATCLIRETLVLGRDGEPPGQIGTCTTVTASGRPVLVDELRLGPEAQVPGMLGNHRVLDQVLDLRPDAPSLPGSLRLDSGGVLHRRLGHHGHDAALGQAWADAEARQSLTEE